MDQAWRDWLAGLGQQTMRVRNRRALVLAGHKQWALSVTSELLTHLAREKALWISANIASALPSKKARTQLGKEYDAIVFDAHGAFDIDAFGAVMGTLCGGGLLLLLVPEKAQWGALRESRFLRRLDGLIESHDSIVRLEQGQSLSSIDDDIINRNSAADVVPPYRTLEQQQVVDAIVANGLSHQAVPIVLVSNRGRGKSSALGLAAGQLLRQGVKDIIVTAPRLTITEPIFQHALGILPEMDQQRGVLQYHSGQLHFMAPDRLLDELPQTDLLLVDEAAAMPLPLLQDLLLHYPRIVFATTIHGYEGSGRGFALKFNQVLDKLAPTWQRHSMETPVRWQQGDPLEAWVDRVLCLDAELAQGPGNGTLDPDDCVVNLVDRDALVRDETKLSALFALLVYAHYRTRPSDLRYLLDEPSVRIYTLEYQQQILAAVLINQEGGFDTALCAEIYRGERRPAGHLLAQTLSLHAGYEPAASYHYARVMRIAVLPSMQGQGLGTRLLHAVVQAERQLGMDAIGSSFGASVELLRFWQRLGFDIVRIGFSRDHASGSHSAVLLKALNPAGKTVFNAVRSRFQRYLPAWLAGPLQGLADDILQQLAAESVTVPATKDTDLLESDWQDIQSFAHSNRGYEACMWPLMKLVKEHSSLLAKLSTEHQLIIQARISNNLDWKTLVKQLGASGKKDALNRLKAAVAALLENISAD